MCPSSAMLCVTLLITMTTRSPPPCSVLGMRKEALMLVRSVCASAAARVSYFGALSLISLL